MDLSNLDLSGATSAERTSAERTSAEPTSTDRTSVEPQELSSAADLTGANLPVPRHSQGGQVTILKELAEAALQSGTLVPISEKAVAQRLRMLVRTSSCSVEASTGRLQGKYVTGKVTNIAWGSGYELLETTVPSGNSTSAALNVGLAIASSPNTAGCSRTRVTCECEQEQEQDYEYVSSLIIYPRNIVMLLHM